MNIFNILSFLELVEVNSPSVAIDAEIRFAGAVIQFDKSLWIALTYGIEHDANVARLNGQCQTIIVSQVSKTLSQYIAIAIQGCPFSLCFCVANSVIASSLFCCDFCCGISGRPVMEHFLCQVRDNVLRSLLEGCADSDVGSRHGEGCFFHCRWSLFAFGYVVDSLKFIALSRSCSDLHGCAFYGLLPSGNSTILDAIGRSDGVPCWDARLDSGQFDGMGCHLAAASHLDSVEVYCATEELLDGLEVVNIDVIVFAHEILALSILDLQWDSTLPCLRAFCLCKVSRAVENQTWYATCGSDGEIIPL